MGMRRNTIHRIWLAWMLLMTFMPLSVVKVFHNHCDETSATCTNTQPGKTHHACDTCPICQFMLSPFIETSPALLTYIPFYIRWETGTFQDKKLATAFYPHYLRGPPSNFRHIV
ncbi:hypothetical protein K0E65_04560 [Bacteroides fragilis]|uniref:DUF2946 domain-containing protein n=2 Tax=Bacteroides fragilis TaxID=817 RepID=A0A081TZD1_BACFG|nr:hypothetical protein BUN20_20795 [Bacteroides fragilis]MBC5613559.1 hypothetical protein [Bacteroides hominis (ex Liu et al. 2022)]MBE7397934.1 hypothetical protein [Bacteroides fragilis]MBY2895956.1 hypothetical protein [Bacteroides fragilis]MBY2903362.1 hypothetical protein [Bacteroides fragilis]